MRKPRLGDLTQLVQSPPTKWRGQIPAQINLVPGLDPSELGIVPHVPWDCRHLSCRARAGSTGALRRHLGNLSVLVLLSPVTDRFLRELWLQLLIQSSLTVHFAASPNLPASSLPGPIIQKSTVPGWNLAERWRTGAGLSWEGCPGKAILGHTAAFPGGRCGAPTGSQLCSRLPPSPACSPGS